MFWVHGEELALVGFATRLDGPLASADVLPPKLDAGFALPKCGARSLAWTTPPRLPPEKIALLDWHNDVSRLILHINEGLLPGPDEKISAALIRSLRRALKDAESRS